MSQSALYETNEKQEEKILVRASYQVTGSSLELLSSDSPASRGNFGNTNLLTPLASIAAVRCICWDPRNRFPSSPYGLGPRWGPCCWSWGTTGGQTFIVRTRTCLGAFVLSLGHIHELHPCFLWNSLHLTICLVNDKAQLVLTLERHLPAPPLSPPPD